MLDRETYKIGWEVAQEKITQLRCHLTVSLFVNAIQVVGILVLLLGYAK